MVTSRSEYGAPVDITVARKVLEIVRAGLVFGIGNPIAGQMCVEAAVCFALGEPHGDEPSCVSPALRAFKITLNDAGWSSNEARAKGLERLALAQLGSKGAHLKQQMQNKLVEHKEYIDRHGEDLPEIRNWKWGAPGARKRLDGAPNKEHVLA